MTMMEPDERTGHPIPAAVSAEAATAPMPSLDDVFGRMEDDLLPPEIAGGMGDACSSAAVPGVMLIDPEILDRAIGSTSFCGDRPEPTSREDEDRLAFLRRYAEADGGLFRRHIVADAAMVAGLKALRAEAPNAGALIDVVERAALLSWHANTPLRVPPVLAVGPPGTGKSRVARRIAEVLQSTLVVIDGGATKDQGPFVGHDVGYRGSGPGKVARALLDGQSSAPCLLVDEVDKVSAYNYGVRPLDSLLALLEPTTAGDFTDCYIGLPMHAEGMVVLMTANDVAGLPGPLLDRVVIVDMPRLNRAATRDAIRRIFAELLVEHCPAGGRARRCRTRPPGEDRAAAGEAHHRAGARPRPRGRPRRARCGGCRERLCAHRATHPAAAPLVVTAGRAYQAARRVRALHAGIRRCRGSEQCPTPRPRVTDPPVARNPGAGGSMPTKRSSVCEGSERRANALVGRSPDSRAAAARGRRRGVADRRRSLGRDGPARCRGPKQSGAGGRESGPRW